MSHVIGRQRKRSSSGSRRAVGDIGESTSSLQSELARSGWLSVSLQFKGFSDCSTSTDLLTFYHLSGMPFVLSFRTTKMLRVVCMLLLLGQLMARSLTPLTTCEKYYFFDHGTNKCEFCCDVCCNAELKRTVDQCETDCPKYAEKLRKENKAQKLQNDVQQLHNDGMKEEEDDEGAGLSSLAKIVIIAICSLFILIVGLVIGKRQAIVRGCRPNPEERSQDWAAAVPLQPQPHSSTAHSTGPTTLHEEEPSTMTYGPNWPSLISSRSSVTTYAQLPTLKTPTQESGEEQSGTVALALHRHMPLNQGINNILERGDEENEDFHSTERKTIQPSLSTLGTGDYRGLASTVV